MNYSQYGKFQELWMCSRKNHQALWWNWLSWGPPQERKTQSVTSKAPPRHHTTFMLHGGNHTCGDHPFTYSASHIDMAVGTKHLKFGLIRPKDRFPPSNVNCSCFLAQASLSFILVSFSSGFFTAIQPWRFDSQSPLNSWCRDVSVT